MICPIHNYIKQQSELSPHKQISYFADFNSLFFSNWVGITKTPEMGLFSHHHWNQIWHSLIDMKFPPNASPSHLTINTGTAVHSKTLCHSFTTNYLACSFFCRSKAMSCSKLAAHLSPLDRATLIQTKFS